MKNTIVENLLKNLDPKLRETVEKGMEEFKKLPTKEKLDYTNSIFNRK